MHAQYEIGRIVIFDSFLFKDSIKEIEGRVWDAEGKSWSVPTTALNVEMLKMLGCKFVGEIPVETPTTKDDTETPVPQEPMPIKAVPFDHQVEGYNLACETMGIFVGSTVR